LRSPSPFIIFALAIILFAAAGAIGVSVAPPVNGSWDNTAKAVGVAVSIAAGIFSPIASIFMAVYQAKITASLRQLEMQYTREVENLKSTLATGLEVKKALIAGKVRAFDQMLTAAHFFYYVIRKLVVGPEGSVDEMLKEADRRAAEASSVVWHLPNSERTLWFEVYQRSIHLASELRAKPENERAKIFEQFATPLGQAIEALEEVGRRAFEEADRYQLKLSPEDLRIFNPRWD
jgi:hypothetical protein